MRKLHVDIETYSSIDITASGSYRMMESSDFEILMIAYAIDNDPIKIVDLAQGKTIPDEFINALLDCNVEKHAHNANFERNAFKKYGYDIPTDQWFCSAVKAAYCGLPLALDDVSKALNLGEKGKLSTGKALIRFFSIPCKPTKANGMRYRNFPRHDLDKWNDFKRYCINDVEAEREIVNQLSKYKIPDIERQYYLLDQLINDRGVLLDQTIARNAISMNDLFRTKILAEMKEITGVDNPNSGNQLKEWLSNQSGITVTSLTKDTIKEMLLQSDDEDFNEILEGREKTSKSSVKKYESMLCAVGDDGRARGLFQFYGAMRTGRWAGRIIQLHNLPQNHMKDLEEARNILISNDYDLALMLYDNIPSVLSELIRTAFIPHPGYIFGVCDFSAIEARVLSWIAGEAWRLEVFRTHGKIYEASASMMFNVPLESITKGSELRQRGKVAELALGYQGAAGAIATMDKDKKIPENEHKTIVAKWRKANPRIVKFWNDLNDNAIDCVSNRKTVRMKYITLSCDADNFMIQLPSGRKLFYNYPAIGTNKFNQDCVTFVGTDQKIKQRMTLDTYGGKLTENIVQAISRDLLANSMMNLYKSGYDIVMHVHDEAVCELESKEKLTEMQNIMSIAPDWANGLPLTASGYITPFYKKD